MCIFKEDINVSLVAWHLMYVFLKPSHGHLQLSYVRMVYMV